MRGFQDRLAQGRFMVLGRVGMDLYADPPGTPVESATRFRAEIGGSAGNIAVALARLGMQAGLLSCVSDDAVGRFCLQQLAGYGVDTGHVRAAGDGRRTSLAVTETRASDCQVVLYRNGAADFALAVQDVDLDHAGLAALVVTGTALAMEPSRAATLLAMDRARAAGVVVVIDIDYRAYSWISGAEAAAICRDAATQADIIVGNDDEWALMADGPGESLARDMAQGRLAVYKRGALGCVTYQDGTRVDTGIYPVTALKPMGAGDAFLGGLLASLAQGHRLDAALRRGAAAAAIVVSGIGCAPASPRLAELDAFIATRQERHAHPAL